MTAMSNHGSGHQMTDADSTTMANEAPATGIKTVQQASQDQQEVISESGDFRVELKPADGSIPLLQLHNWHLRIFNIGFNTYVHPQHVSPVSYTHLTLPTTPYV